MQVGEQHVANRQHALICDQCFCYIGPLELQLGFRLLSLAEQASEPSAPETCSLRQTALDLLSGEVQAPAVEWEPERPLTAAAAAEVPLTLRMLLHHCSVSQQQLPPQQTTKQGSVTVLGNAIILPDGSEWMFCSHDCAALAWTTWAAALSPGPRGQLPQAVRTCSFVEAFDPTQLTPRVLHACTVGGRLDAFPAADLSSANSSTSHGLPPWLHGPADAEAVREFYEHAANSNDIFRVAARAVALAAGAACMFEAACDTGLCSRGHGADERLSALHFAWKPFKSIAKAIWWEHVPMPEDLDDEEAWRADLRCCACICSGWLCRTHECHSWHIGPAVLELLQRRRMRATAAGVCREMACDSLGLLKAAVPGSFPREFLDERIWGCLIGMFELNNLSLQVQTPLELYFLACDDLPEPRRTEVQGQTTVWLDALDTEYDACVEVRPVRTGLQRQAAS